MPFEQDIFISYAHIDNRPFGDTQGWVDQLVERLKVRVPQWLGKELAVWWDARLQGDQYFTGEIGDQVSRTLLLLPIVTPRYANSEWCRGELKEFCRRASQTGGTELRNRSRIYKVVKTPVKREQEPEELRSLLGYVFYELDEAGRPREFSPEVSPNKDPKYWARLDDLARDIAQVLEELKYSAAPAADKHRDAAAPAALPLEKKVYLAEATADAGEARDRVRRELQERGYYVLPDRELPLRMPEFEQAVEEHLSRCAVSVHFVGSSYGIVPEGEEERSVVRLQTEMAARRAAQDPTFARLVWMPQGLEPKGERQARFVSELQSGLGARAELLQTSVEDLKLRVLEKLNPKPSAQTNGDGEVKSVYLVCDDRDAEEVAPIEQYLYDEGFEVIPTIPSDDQRQLAEYHRESLVNCDAALVYYGKANQMWLRSKLWDLQKAQGWGRETPMLAKGVYVSGPPTTEKQRFRTREVPVVIQNFEGFSPDALRPFLQAIRAGEGGA